MERVALAAALMFLLSIACHRNTPPDTPSGPVGPNLGRARSEYTFTDSTADLEGDSVRYLFDWGDGTLEWTRYVGSNAPAQLEHAWSSADSYEIRVMAQDRQGDSSGWSSPRPIFIYDYPYRFLDNVWNHYPKTMTPLPDGSLIYMTTVYTDSVLVLNTATNRYVAGFPMPAKPTAIAAAPDGGHVYVVYADSAVAVLRTSDNSITDNIRLDGPPRYLAISSDGSLLAVTACILPVIWLLRTSDNTVVSTIQVGEEPWTLAFHPDGSRIYVACGRSVRVVRISDGAVVSTIPISGWPNEMAFLPDGRRLYVASSGSGFVLDPGSDDTTNDWMLTEINTDDNSIVAQTPEAYSLVEVLPPGDYLYAWQGGIVVVRTADNRVTYKIPHVWAKELAVLPTANVLYAILEGDNGIAVIGY